MKIILTMLAIYILKQISRELLDCRPYLYGRHPDVGTVAGSFTTRQELNARYCKKPLHLCTAPYSNTNMYWYLFFIFYFFSSSPVYYCMYSTILPKFIFKFKKSSSWEVLKNELVPQSEVPR